MVSTQTDLGSTPLSLAWMSQPGATWTPYPLTNHQMPLTACVQSVYCSTCMALVHPSLGCLLPAPHPLLLLVCPSLTHRGSAVPWPAAPPRPPGYCNHNQPHHTHMHAPVRAELSPGRQGQAGLAHESSEQPSGGGGWRTHLVTRVNLMRCSTTTASCTPCLTSAWPCRHSRPSSFSREISSS